MAPRISYMTLLLTIIIFLVGVNGYNMTGYSSYKMCKTNSTCKANVECCSYMEFSKNGAPVQTISKCIPLSKFEDIWKDFMLNNKNVEELNIGCRLDDDNG